MLSFEDLSSYEEMPRQCDQYANAEDTLNKIAGFRRGPVSILFSYNSVFFSSYALPALSLSYYNASILVLALQTRASCGQGFGKSIPTRIDEKNSRNGTVPTR